MARLHVNGKSYDVATHPSAALLWALRDEVGCSSVKYGCGGEQCGACRVLIDGAPAYSCTMTIADAAGRDIITLESLVETGAASRVVDAMASIDAGQCGYCLPGIVLALTALGAANPSPSRADVVRAPRLAPVPLRLARAHPRGRSRGARGARWLTARG